MIEQCEFLIISGDFKEAEQLIMDLKVSLDDLSEESFTLFKTWIEMPHKTTSLK
jgi:hypothetical protein